MFERRTEGGNAGAGGVLLAGSVGLTAVASMVAVGVASIQNTAANFPPIKAPEAQGLCKDMDLPEGVGCEYQAPPTESVTLSRICKDTLSVVGTEMGWTAFRYNSCDTERTSESTVFSSFEDALAAGLEQFNK